MAFLLIFISSILFGLSFPNPIIAEGATALSSIALAPAFLAIALNSQIKRPYQYGMLFGVLSTLGSYFWLTRFGEFSVWTISGVSMGYLFEYSALFAIIWMCIKTSPTQYRPIALAIIWVAYEYIKSRGYLAFPWTLLAHSIHNVPSIMQLSRITGTWSISLILAYANAILFEWMVLSRAYGHHTKSRFSLRQFSLSKPLYTYFIMRNKYKITKPYAHTKALSSNAIALHFYALIAIAIVVYGYGSISLIHKKTTVPNYTIPMLLVQENVDSWNQLSNEEALIHLFDLTSTALNTIEQQQNPKPQLIVWTETSLSIPYQSLNNFYDYYQYYHKVPLLSPFIDTIASINIPILTGTPLLNKNDPRVNYNAAVLIYPDGSVNDQYGKNNLVPLAEFLPFYEYPQARDFYEQYLGITSGWVPWGQYNTLSLQLDANKNSAKHTTANTTANMQLPRTLQIGVPICFEDAFSSTTRDFVLNGADVLINITNVSWSKTKSAQVQQYAAAKFRAIETGRTLVRSTNSGLTSIIDPWGKTLARIPMFEDQTLYYQVPIYTLHTPFLSIGDSVGSYTLVITLVSIFFMLCALYRKKN